MRASGQGKWLAALVMTLIAVSQPAVSGAEPVDALPSEDLEVMPAAVQRVRADVAHAAGFTGGTRHGNVVRVAVLDSGMDPEDPDLVDNIDTSLGIVCVAPSPYVPSPPVPSGHATQVGRTIAAAVNGSGVVGVAPEVRLVDVVVSSSWSTILDTICGLEHVLALVSDADPANDVHVVSLVARPSLWPATGGCDSDAVHALICALTARGVVVVTAAGDFPADVSNASPSGHPEVIAVSSLRANSQADWLSNYGPGIALAAIGEEVSYRVRGNLGRISGTTAAAPAVAGVAALLKAFDPFLTPTEIRDIMRRTGACPDGTPAGDDGCVGQGTWPLDRDNVTEPLVDAAAATASLRPPGSGIVAPIEGATVGATVPVQVRFAAGEVPVLTEVRVDEGPWQPAPLLAVTGPATWTWDTSTVADGPHRIEVRSSLTGFSDVVDVVVRNAPTISFLTSPPDVTRPSTLVYFDLRAADFDDPPEALVVTVGLHDLDDDLRSTIPVRYDQPSRQFRAEWETVRLPDGPVMATVTVRDTSGGTDVLERYYETLNTPFIAIQPTPPILSGRALIDLAVISRSYEPEDRMTVTWQVGTLTGTAVYRASDPVNYLATVDTWLLPEGPTVFAATVTDSFGRSSTATVDVEVRHTPLAVTVTRPTAQAVISGGFDVTATLTGGAVTDRPGGEGSVWARVDAGPWTQLTYGNGGFYGGLDVSLVEPGEHRLDFAAADYVTGTATASVLVQVAPPRPPGEGIERYVDQLYRDFLGRPASVTERWWWYEQVAQGTPRGEVATYLARSDEWIGVVVDGFYRSTLGRLPDPGGRTYWIQRIRSGTRVAAVAAEFYASPEYYRRVGGTSGAYIDALYRALLGRAADPGGRAYWVQRLTAGASRSSLAYDLFQSTEMRRRRVADLYDRLLGRAPDPEGSTYWTALLLRQDDVALAAHLGSSDEYYVRSQG